MEIQNAEQLERAVLKWGFLPFFKNEIEGFSVEELTPRHLWFSDEGMDGPWEWKGPVICGGMCAYGKFFNKKAGYVSLEWLPDLMNWRRARHCALSPDEQYMLDVLMEHESLLSREWKKLCGYTKSRSPRRSQLEKEMEKEARAQGWWPYDGVLTENRRKGFETVATSLQMGLRCIIADFEYLHDRRGRQYGWGIARYTTPEAMYDMDFGKALGDRQPPQSLQRMAGHLRSLFPWAEESDVLRILD